VELTPDAEVLEELLFLEMAALFADWAVWLTALLLDLCEPLFALLAKSLMLYE
jgi:hypothetical protein